MSDSKDGRREYKRNIPIFTGKGGPQEYLFFADQFKCFLHIEDLTDVLDKTGELSEDAVKKEHMIKAHLLQLVSPEVMSGIRGLTARNAWKSLRRDYFTFTQTDTLNIKRQIADRKWKHGVDTLLSFRDDINMLNAILAELKDSLSGKDLISSVAQNLPDAIKPFCLSQLAKMEDKPDEQQDFNDFISTLSSTARKLGISLDGGGASATGAVALFGGTEEGARHPHHQQKGRGIATGRGRGQGNRTNPDIICHRCKKAGHPARLCKTPWSEAEEAQEHANIALGSHLKGVTTPDQKWVADSGASRHLVADAKMLHNASPFKPGSAPTVITASKERVQAQLHGDITIHVLTDTGAIKEITLRDCLYVPRLGLNLLSTTRFVDERDTGAHFIQSKGQQHLVLPAGEVVPLKMQGGIPWLKTTPVVRALMAGEERGAGGMESDGEIMGGDRENKSKIPTGHRENKSKIPEEGHGENKREGGGGRGTATRTSKDNEDHETALLTETAPLTSKQLLHDRLGHPGKDRLEQVLDAHSGEEWLKHIKDDDMGACESCHTMKARRQPLNKEPTDHSERQPGELLIVDMTGPVAHTSIGGARFALIIQDARTGVTEAYPMVSKDGAPQALQQFHLEQRTLRAGLGIPLLENYTVIQCDNDSVFLGRAFQLPRCLCRW